MWLVRALCIVGIVPTPLAGLCEFVCASDTVRLRVCIRKNVCDPFVLCCAIAAFVPLPSGVSPGGIAVPSQLPCPSVTCFSVRCSRALLRCAPSRTHENHSSACRRACLKSALSLGRQLACQRSVASLGAVLPRASLARQLTRPTRICTSKTHILSRYRVHSSFSAVHPSFATAA